MAKTMGKAFGRDAAALAALSAAKAAWWGAAGLIARRMARPAAEEAAFTPVSPPADMAALRRSWFEAFQKDARDVARGLYPISETFPKDPAAPFRRAFDFLADARAVDARRRRRQGTEVRNAPGLEAYPSYYRQNFHYQTGGWFTEASAERYEAQVEALFSGAAGPMRRRALSLLAKAWRGRDQRALTVLDLACGSGSFLVDLTAAFPRARVFGLDLSAPYLEVARRRTGALCVHGSAERLPFADASFDGVSCIFLFHELPPKVRAAVAGEVARVLKPNGILAFADSAQSSDAPEIARLFEAFPAFFHEPYYATYQASDLTALFAGAGLTLEDRDHAFLTKALLLRKC